MGKKQIFLQGQVIVQNDKDVLHERCTTGVISMLYLSGIESEKLTKSYITI